MRTKIGLAAAVIGALAAVAGGGGMEALEELGSALRSAPAWQCEYRQEYISAGMSAGEVVDGEVLAAGPAPPRIHNRDTTTPLIGH